MDSVATEAEILTETMAAVGMTVMLKRSSVLLLAKRLCLASEGADHTAPCDARKPTSMLMPTHRMPTAQALARARVTRGVFMRPRAHLLEQCKLGSDRCRKVILQQAALRAEGKLASWLASVMRQIGGSS